MNLDAYQDLRRIIREELRGLRLPELAVVQELHPHESASDSDNYACTVRLRDSETVLERVPVMTPRKGLVSIPDVGDLVLVQFLGGSANAPVILGSLYNAEDRPPENAEGEARLRLPADGGDGEGVDLHVSSADTASATVKLGSSLELVLKDDDPVVSIDVGGGQAQLSIDSDGTLTLKSNKAVVLDGTELTFKGTTVAVEAQGELTLKGAIINLN
ncbi:phage baseplate assembly protein V [Sulfitobacter sp. D35]|uniref:phage baseplate assembly protein V n=1 Tax=Sulfitobacter sp. D35 TaxID=3083252 RepID=UPI00296EF03D|nr:phage baseplate assembly protein V [Sulfitobacter sp. D35]MDW4498767.1 phage baseplate assembly protein V [Sulfitobacter sp. D35]